MTLANGIEIGVKGLLAMRCILGGVLFGGGWRSSFIDCGSWDVLSSCVMDYAAALHADGILDCLGFCGLVQMRRATYLFDAGGCFRGRTGRDWALGQCGSAFYSYILVASADNASPRRGLECSEEVQIENCFLGEQREVRITLCM